MKWYNWNKCPETMHKANSNNIRGIILHGCW